MQARLYDGKTAAGQPAELRIQAGARLELESGSTRRAWPADQVVVHDRVGGCAAIVDLPDGGRIEVADAETFFATWERVVGKRQLLHGLESRWPIALACLLVTLGIVAWAVVDGVPAAARVAADLVPDEARRAIGREGSELLDEYLFEPTALPPERQAELQAVFSDIVAGLDADGGYQLRFRRSEALGANAVALPSGIVVMTDELVALADDDDQLAAVLAHEVGHVLNNHALRGLIQNSVAAGLIVALTGDVGSAANLAAGLPTLLLNAAYSREFEREADDTAIAYLEDRQIDPAVLGTLLVRIDERYGRDPDRTSLLSTHPGSQERLERAREGGDRQ